jgi:hypothetical protein
VTDLPEIGSVITLAVGAGPLSQPRIGRDTIIALALTGKAMITPPQHGGARFRALGGSEIASKVR